MSIKLHVIKAPRVKPRSALIKKLAHELLTREGTKEAEINLILVDDAYIQRLNREYLGHDEPTDVIAFELERDEGRVGGEVYVSRETAAEQAREYGVSIEDEILRLFGHGLLHLVGYEDRTPAQKALMTLKEDEYLRHAQSMDS